MSFFSLATLAWLGFQSKSTSVESCIRHCCRTVRFLYVSSLCYRFVSNSRVKRQVIRLQNYPLSVQRYSHPLTCRVFSFSVSILHMQTSMRASVCQINTLNKLLKGAGDVEAVVSGENGAEMSTAEGKEQLDRLPLVSLVLSESLRQMPL